MAIRDELLDIERELWTAGPEAYHDNLDEECLVAFTSMSGISTRGQIAATVGEGPRWRDLEIQVDGLIQPTGDVAILTYRASAVRGEGENYRAVVSSGYVRREDGWKMVFHQQTPLGRHT